MALNINLNKKYRYECGEIVIDGQADYIIKDLNYPNCYVAITNVVGNKTLLEINVAYYADESKSQKLQTKHHTFTPSVADNSANFIAQGYEYLKTLPEFADAVDC